MLCLIFGEIYYEKKIANNHLAKKYCDSLEKNLFKGLDKESTLKYEYFFSSIPDNYIKDENQFLFIKVSIIGSMRVMEKLRITLLLRQYIFMFKFA